MNFREAAFRVLGRDISISDDHIEEYLRNDKATLRADIDCSIEEFNKIIDMMSEEVSAPVENFEFNFGEQHE